MKETKQSPESFFVKVTKSELPNWAKTTIAVSLVLTPLLEMLSKLIIVRQLADLVERLLSYL